MSLKGCSHPNYAGLSTQPGLLLPTGCPAACMDQWLSLTEAELFCMGRRAPWVNRPCWAEPLRPPSLAPCLPPSSLPPFCLPLPQLPSIMSHQDIHLEHVSGHLPTVAAPPAPHEQLVGTAAKVFQFAQGPLGKRRAMSLMWPVQHLPLVAVPGLFWDV